MLCLVLYNKYEIFWYHLENVYFMNNNRIYVVFSTVQCTQICSDTSWKVYIVQQKKQCCVLVLCNKYIQLYYYNVLHCVQLGFTSQQMNLCCLVLYSEYLSVFNILNSVLKHVLHIPSLTFCTSNVSRDMSSSPLTYRLSLEVCDLL